MLTTLIPEERIISSLTTITVIIERGGLAFLSSLGIYKWVRGEIISARTEIRTKEAEMKKLLENKL